MRKCEEIQNQFFVCSVRCYLNFYVLSPLRDLRDLLVQSSLAKA